VLALLDHAIVDKLMGEDRQLGRSIGRVGRSVSAYLTVGVKANIPGQIVGHVKPRQLLWVKYVVHRGKSLGLVQGADVKFEDVTPFGNSALAFPGKGCSARAAEGSVDTG
jgi:hypothetical protein